MLIKFLDGTEREVATLSGANLGRADLRGANLYGAYLSGAELHRANLSGAYLRYANLSCANLRYANLSGAELRGANLQGARGLEQFSILPEGQLIGYKKLADNAIATLMIPADAKRTNAYGSRKCRAEFAYVLSGEGEAKHDGTPYKVGFIKPDKYDPDPRVECSHGIHFFITRKEAEEY